MWLFPCRKRIAVVGNGPVDPHYAKEIERSHIVVRFNQCGNFGVTGEKTTILVLSNSGYPGEHFAFDDRYINQRAFQSAGHIWLVRAPEFLSEVMDSINPEQWELYADYTNEIIENLLQEKKYEIFERSLAIEARDILSKHGAWGEFMPSAGFLAIARLSKDYPKHKIYLYGFTHEGWIGHPWDAERAAIPNLRKHVYARI